jgi:hypothetical protein
MDKNERSPDSHSSPPAFVRDALERLLSCFDSAQVVIGLCPTFDFMNTKNGIVVIADLTKEEPRKRLVADAPQYQLTLYSTYLPKKKIAIGYVGFGTTSKDLSERFCFHIFNVGKSTMDRLVQHRAEAVVADVRLPSFEVEHVVASLLKELEHREKAYAETSGKTHKYRSSFRVAFEFVSDWIRGMVRSKPTFDWMIVFKYAAENDLRSALVLLKKTVGSP